MIHFLPPERKRLFLYFKEKRKSETILWKLLTIEYFKNKTILAMNTFIVLLLWSLKVYGITLKLRITLSTYVHIRIHSRKTKFIVNVDSSNKQKHMFFSKLKVMISDNNHNIMI